MRFGSINSYTFSLYYQTVGKRYGDGAFHLDNIHCHLHATPLTGKVTLQSYIILIGLVFHIPLSLFLGQYIGVLGVVASMSVINLIYACVFTVQIRRILNRTAIGIWNK